MPGRYQEDDRAGSGLLGRSVTHPNDPALDCGEVSPRHAQVVFRLKQSDSGVKRPAALFVSGQGRFPRRGRGGAARRAAATDSLAALRSG
jgi:hypothetical protein